ncbi:MAG: ribonuclease HI [Balneolales bacterium]
MSKPEVSIYTDGACRRNPGPGGWAALLEWQGKSKEISGGEKLTTNNRMEMRAIIEALRTLKKPCSVRIYSDSALIINTFNKGWLRNWQRRNWIKSDKKPVENKDLWQEMLTVMDDHTITWIKVKGHSTDIRNNLVDELAVNESKKFLDEF